jgi:uncharacterized membrane protein YeaQ/YmgE (transglycosylase-associated protein family)
MVGAIIGAIIIGAIIGVLARLVMPGKQNISVLMTVVLGIIGGLVGSWVWHSALNKGNTSGVDWIALIIGVIVAIILIAIYGSVTGRKERV